MLRLVPLPHEGASAPRANSSASRQVNGSFTKAPSSAHHVSTSGRLSPAMRLECGAAAGGRLTSSIASATLRGGDRTREESMKLIIALVAVGFVSSLMVATPASAQKDPACMEKCNRSNIAAGGGMQKRGTAEAVRACISGCPKAGAAKAK